MLSSESNSAAVAELAEEFVARYRQGERPSLREYVERHPELAEQIREVFPAVAVLENIALADESVTDGEDKRRGFVAPESLTQLGDYRIIREVGRGGMGIVYEAEQVSLGRHVALKLLPHKALAGQRHRLRFEREAKAAARLHHTNIVPVFGVGEQDGLPYYVMQFIQGLGMNEVLEELKRLQGQGSPASGELPVSRKDVPVAEVARSLLSGQLHAAADAGPQATASTATVDHRCGATPEVVESPSPGSDSGAISGSSLVLPGQSETSGKVRKQSYWKSVAMIGVQVASALDYAHHQGILHRDVKPSNLLLDTRGTIWVTDFGLAKTDDQENLTHSGDILGTLRYMPPEAFDGKADRRGDVYSLGLTLYELLAMAPAFSEKERHQLIKKVTNAEPARLDAVNPAIPRDLVTIVHKAIDRDPLHRYQQASDLVADLRRFLDDEPIHARRISTVERFTRWCRRNPSVASLIAAVVLVAATGFASTWMQLQNAVDNAAAAKRERDEATRQTLIGKQHLDEATAANASLQEAQERTRAMLYGAHMNMAETAWEAGDTKHLMDLLEQYRPAPGEKDLRGLEWYYWMGQCHNETKTVAIRPRFSGAVLSGDGSRVAEVSPAFDPADKAAMWSIRIWDTATGKEVFRKRIKGQTDDFNAGAAPRGPGLGLGFGLEGIGAPGTPELVMNHDGTRLAVRSFGITDAGKRIIGTADAPPPKAGNLPSRIVVIDTKTGKQVDAIEVGASDSSMETDKAFATANMFINRAGDRLFFVESSVGPGGNNPQENLGRNRDMKMWKVGSGLEPLNLYSWVATFPSFLSPGIFAVSADGKCIGTVISPPSKGSGDPPPILRVWDADTKADLARITINNSRKGPPSPVTGLAISADSAKVAVSFAGGASIGYSAESVPVVHLPMIRIFDLKTGVTVSGIELPQRIQGAPIFSPDGTYVAASPSGDFRSGEIELPIWNVTSGKLHRMLRGNQAPVAAMAFSPDSQEVLTASGDGLIKMWNIGQAKAAMAGPESFSPVSIALNQDGWRVVCSAFAPDDALGNARNKVALRLHADLFDASGTRLHPFEETEVTFESSNGPVRVATSVTFSPDGAKIVCFASLNRIQDNKIIEANGNSAVLIWDTATGKQQCSLALPADAGYVACAGVSADNQRLALIRNTSAMDKPKRQANFAIEVWDVDTKKILFTLPMGTGPLGKTAWSPKGPWLATGAAGSELCIWDGKTGQARQVGNKDSMLSTSKFVFDRSGQRLAAMVKHQKDTEGVVRLMVWELGNDKDVAGFTVGSLSDSGPLAFSHDGRSLAAASNVSDRASGVVSGAITIWDVAHAKQMQMLRAQGTLVTDLSFSPDGRRLVSLGSVKPGMTIEVKVWDLTSEHEVLKLRDMSFGISRILITADGQRLIAHNNREGERALRGGPDRVKVWEALTYAKPLAPAAAVVKTISGFGDAFDLDGDCTISAAAGKMTMTVPGESIHDLTNAPRVLQTVEGDFTLRVKISFDQNPGDKAIARLDKPSHSAGLLVWLDQENCIRLERSTTAFRTTDKEWKVESKWPVLSWIRNGTAMQRGTMANAKFSSDLRSTWFRLSREGAKLSAAISDDGTRWTPIEPLALPLPKALQVGLFATNGAAKSLSVDFEHFELKRK